MATLEERIYQLGTDELAEQERHVSELRGRPPALLAAGAIVPSLLARRCSRGTVRVAWRSCSPWRESGVVLLASALLILVPYEMGFSLNATVTYRFLFNEKIVERPGIDLVLADALHERRPQNQTVVDKLTRYHGGGGRLGNGGRWFCRRRGANLVGEMADQPKQEPSADQKPPAPGSLPKLPQTAFNREKKGGDVSPDRKA
jgi:hypothetical protein